jgi:hypothetical protein
MNTELREAKEMSDKLEEWAASKISKHSTDSSFQIYRDIGFVCRAFKSILDGDVVVVPREKIEAQHTFWNHYSCLAEWAQDDIADERDKMLSDLGAMIQAAEKGE